MASTAEMLSTVWEWGKWAYNWAPTVFNTVETGLKIKDVVDRGEYTKSDCLEVAGHVLVTGASAVNSYTSCEFDKLSKATPVSKSEYLAMVGKLKDLSATSAMVQHAGAMIRDVAQFARKNRHDRLEYLTLAIGVVSRSCLISDAYISKQFNSLKYFATPASKEEYIDRVSNLSEFRENVRMVSYAKSTTKLSIDALDLAVAIGNKNRWEIANATCNFGQSFDQFSEIEPFNHKHCRECLEDSLDSKVPLLEEKP